MVTLVDLRWWRRFLGAMCDVVARYKNKSTYAKMKSMDVHSAAILRRGLISSPGTGWGGHDDLYRSARVCGSRAGTRRIPPPVRASTGVPRIARGVGPRMRLLLVSGSSPLLPLTVRGTADVCVHDGRSRRRPVVGVSAHSAQVSEGEHQRRDRLAVADLTRLTIARTSSATGTGERRKCPLPSARR